MMVFKFLVIVCVIGKFSGGSIWWLLDGDVGNVGVEVFDNI